jgi:hypothetical protein
VLFAVPVGAWLIARWRLDEWLFISRIFTYDFAARTLTVIEDHPGTPFYYLNILQRNQFDWFMAGVVAWLHCGVPLRRIIQTLSFWRAADASTMLAASWGVIAFLVPTLMRTKLTWYLNPFYPPFALGVGWLFVRGVETCGHASINRRPTLLLAVFLIACVTAETRLMWYSFNRRSLAASTQGFLLSEKETLRGQKVFSDHWSHSERFVLEGIVGAEEHEAESVEAFFRMSAVGDYLLVSDEVADAGLLLVRTNGRHLLFRRSE